RGTGRSDRMSLEASSGRTFQCAWRVAALLTLVFAHASCASQAPATAAPEDIDARVPAAWAFPLHPEPVAAESAMVVTDAPLATDVGVRVLRAGGNAMDAAVATAFALAVVYPEAGNIGGGGFIVTRLADGTT